MMGATTPLPVSALAVTEPAVSAMMVARWTKRRMSGRSMRTACTRLIGMTPDDLVRSPCSRRRSAPYSVSTNP
jgi:hypothetical protein